MKKYIQKTLEKLYVFMNRNQLNRRMIGAAIALILIGGIYLVGNGVVNAVQENIARARIQQEKEQIAKADPKDYVNFYQVTVSDTPIGEAPQLRLCRKLGHGTITIDAVRTFIQFADGTEKQVAERAFKAAIEQSATNTDCTTVDLQGQPQIAGEFQIFTEYCFREPKYNIKKCDNYRSNKYEMTNDLEQLKQRLDALQKEYDRRLNGGSVDPAPLELQSTNGLQSSGSSSGQSDSTPAQSGGSGSSNPSNNNGNGNGNSNNGGSGSSENSNGVIIDLPFLPPVIIGG